MKYRLALVNYLNSVPLGWGFTEGPYHEVFDLTQALPSACADRLQGGEAHIGLIPAIEYARVPGLKVVPNVAIASRQRVRSILLISRRPIESVGRVAVDTSSRTSVALLRVLLSHFYGTPAEFTPHPPDLEAMLAGHDAALIIGDPALRLYDAGYRPGPAPAAGGYRVYDLVEEWRRFTGRPFVFAFWALRPEVELGDRVRLFEKSKRLGLANLDVIVRRHAQLMGLPAEVLRQYLTECVSYDLDAENLDGLAEFYRLAHGLAIIDHPAALQFA